MRLIYLFESSQSQKLNDMVARDQKLRSEFNALLQGRKWSQELVDQFCKTHGTNKDDVFGDKENHDEFYKLVKSNKLDYSTFTQTDWTNFWTLAQHMREKYPGFQELALKIMRQYNLHNTENYNNLLFDLAKRKGLISQEDIKKISDENGTVDLTRLGELDVNWDELAKQLKVNN